VVFRATSDTEVILRLIQKNLDLGLRGAIKATMEKIEGAYSVVGITRNKFLPSVISMESGRWFWARLMKIHLL
jgi:glutamine phosphoribosylpyrophosphate amidotransferase